MQQVGVLNPLIMSMSSVSMNNVIDNYFVTSPENELLTYNTTLKEAIAWGKVMARSYKFTMIKQGKINGHSYNFMKIED